MSVWKRHRVTAGLVLTAALLGAVAFWDRGRISTDESTARKLQLFDAWRPDDIDSLIVESPRGRIELTHVPEANGEHGFALKEQGKTLAADEQEIEDFLVTLEYAGFERRADNLDRTTLGFDAPHLVVTVSMGKLRYVLRVGNEAPSPKGARYAEVEGGGRPTARYVLKPELVKALDEQPGTLRSKQLSPYVSSDVERYELSGPNGFTLSRAGSGGRATIDLVVESKATGKVRASYRTVDAWTTALSRLEATTFVEDPSGSKGTSTLTIVPRGGKKPKAVLEFGGTCEGGGTLVRRLEPDRLAACVDPHILESVEVDPARFADAYVLGLPETDVTEVTLRDDETTVEIARRGEGFHMRKPDDAQIEARIGNALLERIAHAEGERVSTEDASDAGKLGLTPPRAHVRIVGLPDRAAGPDAPEHIEELDVGTPKDGVVYVRRTLDGTVLKLAEDIAAPLLPAPSALRTTQLLDIPLGRIRGLELDCGGKHQSMIRDAKGAWTRTAPSTDLRVDLNAANELIEVLRTLQVVRWDAERAAPRHGLEAPWCTIRMRHDGGDSHHAGHGGGDAHPPSDGETTTVLALGHETEGGYFARREGSTAVFVAPRPIAAMSREWLLDRGALLVDSATVDRVVLHAARRQFDIVRRGDAWTLPSGSSANDTRATAIGKALDTLVAEGVATLGTATPDEGFESPRLRVEVIRRDGEPPIEWLIGATSVWHDTKVAFVRRNGVAATFAVALARLAPLLDAL